MKFKEKERVKTEFIEKMDYDELMKCTRCGFCLPSCPTYNETGKDEVHSPRGRIALMKALVDGKIEPSEELKNSIDLCLGCRACEMVCPSGVNFGRLLEQARDVIYQNKSDSKIEKTMRHLLFNKLFPYQNRVINLTSLLGLYQRSKFQKIVQSSGVLNLFPDTLKTLERVLPDIPKRAELKHRPDYYPPIKNKKTTKRVAFFSGCLMDTIFMKSNDSTLKLLQYAGCEVIIPEKQVCCGALHGHNGEKELAKELAKQNIEAFEKADIEYIVTNAGGCGAFLEDYAYLLKDDPEWAERAIIFTNKIKDITSILVELEFDKLPLRLDEQIVTYQDSCHLRNGQKVLMEPRKLLQSIEGVHYVEMEDAGRCCGSAGIYNILQSEMSMQILDDKMKKYKRTNAQIIVTTNPGCLLQMKLGIEREGLSKQVEAVHIVDILIKAYENMANK